ncbi:hypothetical protein [Pseudomonas putida]
MTSAKNEPLKNTPHKALEDQIKTRELENQLAGLTPGKLAKMTTAAGQVQAAIDAGTDIVNSVVGLKDAVMNLYGSFEGAKAFADRHRSLEMVVVNATRRRLVWENSFFDSGTTFAGPMPLNVLPVDTHEPVGATLWTVANGQGSVMTGVSGAGKWRIEGTRFALVVGFTNPQFGSFKSEIGVVGRDAAARIAYDACDNVDAKQYEALGYTVSVIADEAKAGGNRRFVFCITETPHEGDLDRGDTLNAGEYLAPGQYLISPNGQFVAAYSSELGNVAVYDINQLRKLIWSTGPSRRTAWRCGLEADGTFAVLEGPGKPVWTAPATAPGGYIKLADDGSLRLFDSTHSQVWNSQ